MCDRGLGTLCGCELCAAYGQDYAIGVAKVQAQQEAASTGQKALTWLIYVAETRILVAAAKQKK